MRSATRGRAAWMGVALAIGVAVATAPAGADGAVVSSAVASLTPNPAFAPNATDAVNPAVGADARVHVVANDGRGGQTLVTLDIEGLPAGRSFGAHLHRDSCSSSFGGPHYQAPDPANPVAANADADHEVWLDFTTNASGRGRALAVVPFEVQVGARAVVLHQGEHTMAGGTAGQRLACINVSI
jgi:superoxide dismutase, Cu-Zn family